MARPLGLRVEGARQNNLRNISLEIPHDRLTVITGVSGSGKSSLAFDTLFAEGQWRYRVPLDLRADVPRADRPARRGPHRADPPRGGPRAEEPRAHRALHRGHRDRDLRLPPAAV